jgi:hypothetical protein
VSKVRILGALVASLKEVSKKDKKHFSGVEQAILFLEVFISQRKTLRE